VVLFLPRPKGKYQFSKFKILNNLTNLIMIILIFTLFILLLQYGMNPLLIKYKYSTQVKFLTVTKLILKRERRVGIGYALYS